MASPSDFTNQARNRLMGVLGVGSAPATRAITPAGSGGGSAFTAASRGRGQQPGAAGRTCTNDRDCGQNTRCQAGVCVARGGGGGGTTPGTATGTTPAPGGGNACTKNSDCGSNKACINGTCQRPDQTQAGRQCTRGSDCPPGKNCVNGNCVDRGGGGGGGGGEEDDTGRDCRRNRQCPNGKICNQETGKCEKPGGEDQGVLCGGKKCKDGQVCNDGVCQEPTSAQQCGAGLPACPNGETCNGGVCVKPTPDGELADQINANPQVYLANLAGANVMGSPGLKTGSVTPFGRFLANRFNDIQNQYEAEALTQSNLNFRDWLRTKSQYGNPYLEMGDGPTVGVPGMVDDDEALGTQGRKDDGCNGRCDKQTEKCRRGVCVPKGASDDDADTPGIPTYENLNAVRNIWRNDYYGASAYDRGISPANFGGGSTRWSAW